MAGSGAAVGVSGHSGRGVYFYADGTPGPGDSWKAGGKSWTWDGTGIPPVFPATGLANTLVVDYEPSGRGKLA